VCLGLMAVLFPQTQRQFTGREKYGFQAIYAPRTFDTVQTVVTQGLLNYSYQTEFGTRISVSIGASDFLIPGTSASVGNFKSGFATAYRLGVKHNLGGLYVSGELWYYYAEGNNKAEKPDSVTYSFQNTYYFYESPLQIGYDFVGAQLVLTIGVTTSFLYGKNQKALTVLHRGYPMDFGNLTTEFISRLPVGLTAGISVPLTSDYSLQLAYSWYSSKGFAASLALWAVAK